MTIETERLLLIPATLELAETELNNIELFSKLLNAQIPNNWPPETLADARQFFLDLIEKNPDWVGWLAWYSVLKPVNNEMPVLVGSAGFIGAPDEYKTVETGYSVLPQYEGLGYATEMVIALSNWAKAEGVKKIIAHTDDDNLKSQRVLLKASFNFCCKVEDENKLQYSLLFNN